MPPEPELMYMKLSNAGVFHRLQTGLPAADGSAILQVV